MTTSPHLPQQYDTRSAASLFRRLKEKFDVLGLMFPTAHVDYGAHGENPVFVLGWTDHHGASQLEDAIMDASGYRRGTRLYDGSKGLYGRVVSAVGQRLTLVGDDKAGQWDTFAENCKPSHVQVSEQEREQASGTLRELRHALVGAGFRLPDLAVVEDENGEPMIYLGAVGVHQGEKLRRIMRAGRE